MDIAMKLWLSFMLALLMQLLICFKIKKGFLKAPPLVIGFLAFFYAGARFFGIISYPGDALGIYDGGLTDGILIGSISAAGLFGIALAWVIHYFIRINTPKGRAHGHSGTGHTGDQPAAAGHDPFA